MASFVRAFLFALCLSAVAVAAPQSGTSVAPPGDLDASLLIRIDALAAGEADAGLLSGVILVARGDRIVFQRAYGFASWELRVPNTPATRFGIGSITKVMTETSSTCSCGGPPGPRTRPSTATSGVPDRSEGRGGNGRHLLDHRAGVPHRVTTAMEETLPLHPVRHRRARAGRGLLFEPGTKELYSSAGFTCLARVIEVIEGSRSTRCCGQGFRPASMERASGETGQ